MTVVARVFPDGDAHTGALAAALTAAFATARDADPREDVVFVAQRTPTVADAVAALTRSLALEWAPEGIRVNAITCAAPEQADVTLAWLATPPAAMLTGAVLEAR